MSSGAPPPARRRPARLLPVGSFFGVPIYFSPSWLLIAALITVTYSSIFSDAVEQISRPASYLSALAFAAALALCVLAHELGHVAVSLALGRPVRRVVIFLLGGVSEIEQDPERPGEEFLVAVAGPAVSLGVAAAAAAGRAAVDGGTILAVLFALLAWSNLVVAVFNLLPGLPLDGGRALRAAVWRVCGSRVTATRIASWAGRVIAILVVLPGLIFPTHSWGFATTLFGFALGAFIWFGATQSLRAAQLEERLPALDLPRLIRPGILVHGDVSVAEALRRTWEANAGGVVVVDAADQPVAIVDERQVRAVPADRRPWTAATEVARPLASGLVLPVTLTGTALIEAVRRAPASEYLVVGTDGAPAGILAATDLAAALGEPAR